MTRSSTITPRKTGARLTVLAFLIVMFGAAGCVTAPSKVIYPPNVNTVEHALRYHGARCWVQPSGWMACNTRSEGRLNQRSRSATQGGRSGREVTSYTIQMSDRHKRLWTVTLGQKNGQRYLYMKSPYGTNSGPY